MATSARGRAPGAPPRLRILATVTFDANKLQSHLLPLVDLPEVESITLVADRAAAPLPKVRQVVPPRWLVRLAGRAGAKLLVCLAVARRERPDWVIGFNFVPHGFNARLVARLTGARSLYHMIGGEREWLGGGWSSENSVLGRLPRPWPWLERRLLRLIGSCTLVATMGPAGRRSLLERGVDPGRVHVVPPSIDLARFAPAPADERPYDVVTVSRLTVGKRTRDLVEALALLRRRGREATLAIAGDGPVEAELRQLAGRLGVAPQVSFLGFREDLETVYAESRVFVLASAFEGLPGAMLEAMACGVPPVVSDVGEIGGFVRDGENGFVFSAGDVETLADRLELLLGDEALRARLAAAAVEDARRLVSTEAVAGRYRELFGLGPAAAGALAEAEAAAG